MSFARPSFSFPRRDRRKRNCFSAFRSTLLLFQNISRRSFLSRSHRQHSFDANPAQSEEKVEHKKGDITFYLFSLLWKAPTRSERENKFPASLVEANLAGKRRQHEREQSQIAVRLKDDGRKTRMNGKSFVQSQERLFLLANVSLLNAKKIHF